MAISGPQAAHRIRSIIRWDESIQSAWAVPIQGKVAGMINNIGNKFYSYYKYRLSLA